MGMFFFFCSATTLYDRPPVIFKPIDLKEKHNFLSTLCSKYNELVSDDKESLFTEITGEGVKLKDNRPGILVSSTSWTEDEDFSVLLSALEGITIML